MSNHEHGAAKANDKIITAEINLTMAPPSPLVDTQSATGLASKATIPEHIQSGQSLYQPDILGNWLMMCYFDALDGNAIFTEEEWEELASLSNFDTYFDSKKLENYILDIYPPAKLRPNRDGTAHSEQALTQQKEAEEAQRVKRQIAHDKELSPVKRNRIKVIIEKAYSRAKSARFELGLPPGSIRRCGDVVSDRVGNDLILLDIHNVIQSITDIKISLSNHDCFFIASFNVARELAKIARTTGRPEDESAYYEFIADHVHIRDACSSWSIFVTLENMNLDGPERMHQQIIAPYMQSLDLLNYSKGVSTTHAPRIKKAEQTDQQAHHDTLKHLSETMIHYFSQQLSQKKSPLATRVPNISQIQIALESFLAEQEVTEEKLELWTLFLNGVLKTLLVKGLILGDTSKLDNKAKKSTTLNYLKEISLNLSATTPQAQRELEVIARKYINNPNLKNLEKQMIARMESINEYRGKISRNIATIEMAQSILNQAKETMALLAQEKLHIKGETDAANSITAAQNIFENTGLSDKEKLLNSIDMIKSISSFFTKAQPYISEKLCTAGGWNEVENELTPESDNPDVLEASKKRPILELVWGRANPIEESGYTLFDNQVYGHMGKPTQKGCIDSTEGRRIETNDSGEYKGFEKLLAIVPPQNPALVQRVDEFFRASPNADLKILIHRLTQDNTPENRGQLADLIVTTYRRRPTFHIPALGKRNPTLKVVKEASSSNAHDAMRGQNFKRLFMLWLDYHVRNTPASNTTFWAPMLGIDAQSESQHTQLDQRISALGKIIKQENEVYYKMVTKAITLSAGPTASRENRILTALTQEGRHEKSDAGEMRVLQIPTSALIPGGLTYITPNFDPNNMIEAVALNLPLDYLQNFGDPVSNALLSSNPKHASRYFQQVFGKQPLRALNEVIGGATKGDGTIYITPPTFPNNGIRNYVKQMATLSKEHYEKSKHRGDLPLLDDELQELSQNDYHLMGATAAQPILADTPDALLHNYQVEINGTTLILSAMPDARKEFFIGYIPTALEKNPGAEGEIRAMITSKYISTLKTAWELHCQQPEQDLTIIFDTSRKESFIANCVVEAVQKFLAESSYNNSSYEIKSKFHLSPTGFLMKPKPKSTPVSKATGGSIFEGGQSKSAVTASTKSKSGGPNNKTDQDDSGYNTSSRST